MSLVGALDGKKLGLSWDHVFSIPTHPKQGCSHFLPDSRTDTNLKRLRDLYILALQKLDTEQALCFPIMLNLKL